MFSRCVPGATWDMSRSADAWTQIGMSHDCRRSVDAGSGSPVASSYAYLCGRTACWPASRGTQNRPYPSSEIAPVQNQAVRLWSLHHVRPKPIDLALGLHDRPHRLARRVKDRGARLSAAILARVMQERAGARRQHSRHTSGKALRVIVLLSSVCELGSRRSAAD